MSTKLVAAQYASGELSIAFTAGYAAGTGMYYVLDHYSPDVTGWIGQEVAGVVSITVGDIETPTPSGSGALGPVETISWGGNGDGYSSGGYDGGASMDGDGGSSDKGGK